MMKKAVQFGAGNIGRGFIGAVLAQSGYHVVFADVNDQIVSKINEEKKYTVHVMDSECSEILIDNISAIDSRNPMLYNEIAESQLITTAVGLRILPFIAESIAKGIEERKNRNIQEYFNVIACENGLRATTQLKEAVYNHMDDALKAYSDRWVGFPDCSVDRIVPPIHRENPIDVVVEKFYEWNVEKCSIAGTLPNIQDMNLADNLIAYIERKLFTLNTGHAITAYLGKMKGLHTIEQSIADEQIFSIVKGAMQQSGEGLVAKYGFDHDAHFAYIDKILKRFRNPYLEDDVTRVGREPLRKLAIDDRLIKPAMTAASYGFPIDNLLIGIGAALHYDNPEDPQSVELQQKISQMGLKSAVSSVTSLREDDVLVGAIVDAYDKVESIFLR